MYILVLQDLPQHAVAFNSNGEFATASTNNNVIALWPQPVENGRIMAEKKKVCTVDMKSICRYAINNHRS